jgi:glycosyltransferase involved in cell wall biosynthesis
MTKPTVSVVIPYYNGARFIGQALDSVRAQTHQPHEVIVVDDGSHAEEAAALDLLARDAIVLHLGRNRGPSVARNAGVAHATGEWIAFLDADDRWENVKLAAQLAYLRQHPECRAVHTGMRALLEDGRDFVTEKGLVRFEDFLTFPCPVFPSSILMHRQALIECGLFDPTKRCCEDLDLFLRFSYEHPIHAVPEPLLIRRVRPDGLSRNLPVFWQEADRVYREYRSVFRDRAAAGRTLLGVHVDFVLRAIYAREFRLLWRMLRPAVRHDVSLLRLVPRVLAALVRNRFVPRPGPQPALTGGG